MSASRLQNNSIHNGLHMASQLYYLSYDQLVGLSEAYDKNGPAYCAPDRYGVKAEECEAYLKKLIRGERWSRRFISSLLFLTELIVFVAFFGYLFIYAKHSPIYMPFLVGLIAVGVAFGMLRLGIALSICPPVFLKRPFYPSTNKNVEQLFADFLVKDNSLKMGKEEQLNVICQSHPEVAACCQAVREELAHPSGDFIIGDLRFGMNYYALQQSAVYRGIETLRRLNSPRHKVNYLHFFFSYFWSINYANIHYEMNDGCLSGIRISGSNNDDDFFYEEMEEYSEYEACRDRLNEVYGQLWLVDGKKISLFEEDSSMTIQIRKDESIAPCPKQMSENQNIMEKNLTENNANSKKEKEKVEEPEEHYDDSYIPGAHFHNWING